jgi:hypothetical protein
VGTNVAGLIHDIKQGETDKWGEGKMADEII